MPMNTIVTIIFSIVIIFGACTQTANESSTDQDLQIYLCFGQSNMEGVGVIEPQDTIVDDRFMVYQSIDCLEKGIPSFGVGCACVGVLSIFHCSSVLSLS